MRIGKPINKIDNDGLKNMARIVNVLRNISFDNSQFTTSHSQSGINVSLVKQVPFEVRGILDPPSGQTERLYQVVELRAYLKSDDSLVDVGEAFDVNTQYLFPTFDWVRYHIGT